MARRDFKIGDKIIMNSQANEHYGLTKEGSIGVIQKIKGDLACVLFSKLTGGGSTPDTYDVQLECMDLLEPEPPKEKHGIDQVLKPWPPPEEK